MCRRRWKAQVATGRARLRARARVMGGPPRRQGMFVPSTVEEVAYPVEGGASPVRSGVVQELESAELALWTRKKCAY
jgi:hypothetical protein